jgi:hypothetical protein
MWLFNEIQLAKIQDGSNAVLLEHFLTLLRTTGNHVILAETSSTWKKIPNYMNQPLPWTLNEILRDLETAYVTTLKCHQVLMKTTYQIQQFSKP